MKDGARQRRSSSAIHQGLTGARELVGTPYLADRALREQYVREIAPRTEAAVGRVLDHLRDVVGIAPPARVLDLGAGTGAVGKTLRARFGDATQVVAVDRIAGEGVTCANLAVELPAVEGRFELVVAAHLLNELFVERAPADRIALRTRRVVLWARSLLAPGGLLILIEPALRDTSRELLAVRDQALAAGLHVVAPCFWQGPCPALAAERDWCHDSAPVPSRPRVDFSYVVLRAEPAPIAPDLYRVVSDQMPDKGRMRLYLCGPAGRQELIRLKRHRGPRNAALDRVSRGGALSIQGVEATGGLLRVTPETIAGVPSLGR